MTSGGDIRAWLAEFGFAQYAEAFVSDAIDLKRRVISRLAS
jgi:hypothetical protein